MSVMPAVPAARFRHTWPLWLMAAAAIVCALLAWQHWPAILLQSVLWQKTLHQQMTALLQQVAANPHQAGLTLMGFSLLYGVLHALGPGHGKVVIATFLATHPTRVKTSLQLTLAAALVQGAVAVLLVTVMLVVLQLSSRQLHLSSWWLEKGSYLLVAGLGLWLCWRALGRLRLALRPDRAAPGAALQSAGGAVMADRLRQSAAAAGRGARSFAAGGLRQGGMIRLPDAGATARPASADLTWPDHQHSAACGCGHQHLPDARQLAAAVGWKTKLMVVLSMGLRPCSGAIMMLLFSKVIGVYWWGVFSAVVMAAGTALTVSAMALLVQLSRVLARRLCRNGPQAAWQPVALSCLAFGGGLLLVLAGVVLWLSAQPAISGGIRPLFH